MVQEKVNLLSQQPTQENKEGASMDNNSNNNNNNSNDNNEEEHIPKITIKERIFSWLPTWLQFRKDLKASIAILVGLIFALANHTRDITGLAVILVPIVMLFYFPVRPYGVQTEAVIYGTTGAVVAALYSLLGTYLADLARDHTIKNPIQPGVCAILGVFLFFGVFVLNYIRMNYLKANFAVVNGCILICFTFTYGAVYPVFDTELTWIFLRPIAIGGAFSLATNYFLWPDDSLTIYMTVINKVLMDCEVFFKENSEAFLEMQKDTGVSSLSALRSKLQGGVLLLIDCKRAVQREITYAKLTPTDISSLTRIVKSMYPTLHGLGLSNILEKDFLSNYIQDPLLKNAHNEDSNDNHPVNYDDDDDTIHFHNKKSDYTIISGFEDSVDLMKVTGHFLTKTAVECLQECRNGLSGFQKKPRTTLNSILWPFPRISFFRYNQQEMEDIESARHRLDQATDLLQQALQKFDQVQQSNKIQRYIQICKKIKRESMESYGSHMSDSFISDAENYTYGPLYLIYLYQTSLREYCSQVLELAHFIQQLQNERKQPKIHFLKCSFKKWFENLQSTGSTYNDNGGSDNNTQLAPVVGPDSTNLDIMRTTTRQNILTDDNNDNNIYSSHELNNNNNDDDPNDKKKKKKKKLLRSLYLDPDVLPPSNFMERFFDNIHKIYLWLTRFNTVFALKTALGVVLFAIPAWRVESAQWYNDYKGQWCLITICLWLFPTSGLYLFGIYTRVLGSVVGAVVGGIVWEIARGNPYGAAALCFVLFFPFYHVFFYQPMYRVAALLGKITLILVVVYGYNDVLDGISDINSIWVRVVAHRLVAIIIGILAAGLLIMFPAPVQGRIELRKRLAITIRDIGHLYGILQAELSFAVTDGEPTKRQIKHFRKIIIEIRRQLTDEKDLLAHTKYEPPLRGKYPMESYAKILSITDNMADLVEGMGFNLRKLDPNWRKKIAKSLINERKEYLSNIMTTLNLISNTLATKTPLPPFLLQPKDAMDRFAKILETEITLRVQDMEDPSFTHYSAYMMNASSFVTELNSLLEATTTLVGTEAPDLWLKLYH